MLTKTAPFPTHFYFYQCTNWISRADSLCRFTIRLSHNNATENVFANITVLAQFFLKIHTKKIFANLAKESHLLFSREIYKWKLCQAVPANCTVLLGGIVSDWLTDIEAQWGERDVWLNRYAYSLMQCGLKITRRIFDCVWNWTYVFYVIKKTKKTFWFCLLMQTIRLEVAPDNCIETLENDVWSSIKRTAVRISRGNNVQLMN